MRLIEKLEPSRHVQGRFLVWLEGEREPLRVTENEVASFALYSGRTLEEEELAELRQAGGLSSAKARGARMLGERPLSKRELIRRLEQKGDAPEHAQAAADWLEEIGALNELDYARSVVRHYTARGYGGQKLRQEFQRRGIAREFWDQALEEQSDPVERVTAFLKKKLRGQQDDPKAVKRTTDALLRRGFRWEEIRAGLARYGAEIEEESI